MKRLYAGVLLLLMLTVTVFAAEGLPQVIISQSILQQNSVEVYFNITDAVGEQIPLTLEDLTIEVTKLHGDQIPYQINSLHTVGEDGVAYVLGIDLSTSVNGFDVMKASIFSLIDSMGPRDRAAIVTFGDTVEVAEKFTYDQEALKATINSLQGNHQWTKLYGGMKTAIAYARTASTDIPARRVIVLYTDGFDYNSGGETKMDVINELRSARVYPFYALQFDAGRDEQKQKMLQDFKEVISESNGMLVTVAGKGIGKAYDIIYDTIDYEYVLDISMDAEPGDYAIRIKTQIEGLDLEDNLRFYINRELALPESDAVEQEVALDLEPDIEVEPDSEDRPDLEEALDLEDEHDSDGLLERIDALPIGFLALGFGFFSIIFILVLVLVLLGLKKKKPKMLSAVTTIEGIPIVLKPFHSNHIRPISVDLVHQIVIGNDANQCDVTYPNDGEILPLHLVLEKIDDRIYVFNAQPSAESFVNGIPLMGKREVVSGDILALGRVEILLMF